jgi:hypothetical protein
MKKKKKSPSPIIRHASSIGLLCPAALSSASRHSACVTVTSSQRIGHRGAYLRARDTTYRSQLGPGWLRVNRRCGAQEFDLASRKIGSGQSVYEHGVRAYIWKKDTVWIELQRDPLYCQLYESAILDFVLRRSALLPPICPTDSLRQNDDDM